MFVDGKKFPNMIPNLMENRKDLSTPHCAAILRPGWHTTESWIFMEHGLISHGGKRRVSSQVDEVNIVLTLYWNTRYSCTTQCRLYTLS